MIAWVACSTSTAEPPNEVTLMGATGQLHPGSHRIVRYDRRGGLLHTSQRRVIGPTYNPNLDDAYFMSAVLSAAGLTSSSTASR